MAQSTSQNNARRLDDFRQGRFLLSKDEALQRRKANSPALGNQQSAYIERNVRDTSSKPISPSLANKEPLRKLSGQREPSNEELDNGNIQRHGQGGGLSQIEKPSIFNSNKYGTIALSNEMARKQRLEVAREQDSDLQSQREEEMEQRKKLQDKLNHVKELRNKKVRSSILSNVNLFGLLKQVNFVGDIPYFLAIGAGMFKDVLDFAFIGSFPVIGTVLTFCTSIFIFFMTLIAGNSEKRKRANTILKRLTVLGGGTIIESFFGLNFFPVETATAGVVYLMELRERREKPEESEEDFE